MQHTDQGERRKQKRAGGVTYRDERKLPILPLTEPRDAKVIQRLSQTQRSQSLPADLHWRVEGDTSSDLNLPRVMEME